MGRSANEVMHDAIVAAVLDAIAAWKASAGGLANVLARDLGAVHSNTTLNDLPKDVQFAIAASTREAFGRLLKEGYTVSKGGPPPRTTQPNGSRPIARDGRPLRHPPGSGKPPIVETKRGPPGGGNGRGGPSRGH
jgi:hypothetical protein